MLKKNYDTLLNERHYLYIFSRYLFIDAVFSLIQETYSVDEDNFGES